jgi:hypothetical protein
MWENPPPLELLLDKKSRLENLYHVIDKSGNKVPFKLNWAQEQLHNDRWNKTIILKARQLGCTTFWAIDFLDDCFWQQNMTAGIIAHRREDAENIFRSKVKFAYDNMPDWTRAINKARNDRAGELMFENGSNYRVSTGFRSGTCNRLLVSEYGKICCQSPDAAKEIMTGSLNTVAEDQVVVVESTAEGREGNFYSMCQEAKKVKESGRKLNKMDFKFHFLSWMDEPSYRLK